MIASLKKKFDQVNYSLGYGRKCTSQTLLGRMKKKKKIPGSPVPGPWYSLLRAQVQSLLGKLRFPKPCSVAKKKKKGEKGRVTSDHNLLIC